MSSGIREVEPGVFLVGEGAGARRVFPIKKDLGRPLSWSNLDKVNFFLGGSWGRFGRLVLLFCLLMFLAGAYAHDTGYCRELVEGPCLECRSSRCLANVTQELDVVGWDVGVDIPMYDFSKEFDGG